MYKLLLYAILLLSLQKNKNMKIRIKECLKKYGMQQQDLAKKMGIKPISLSQMLARNKFSVEKLEQIANLIGCSVVELIAEQQDFASFVRYRGIHYTADNIDDFFKQVEEIKTMEK